LTEALTLFFIFFIFKMSRSIILPGQLEMCQPHIHLLQHCRERQMALRGHQGEAVPHRDQTQVHHKRIVGHGGLRDDDEGGLQLDIHGETEALLGEVPHTGGCLFCRLGCSGAQGLLGRLEVVHKHLKQRGGWWPTHRQMRHAGLCSILNNNNNNIPLDCCCM